MHVLLGRILGDARERAGFSQASAARALGMVQSTLAAIETGDRRLLFTDAIKVASLYRIPMSELDLANVDRARVAVRRSRGRPRLDADQFGPDPRLRRDEPRDILRKVDEAIARTKGGHDVDQAVQDARQAIRLLLQVGFRVANLNAPVSIEMLLREMPPTMRHVRDELRRDGPLVLYFSAETSRWTVADVEKMLALITRLREAVLRDIVSPNDGLRR